MSKYGKHIAFFLLLLFSFMQLAELHVFDFDHDSHDDCVMCHFSSEKNDQTFILDPLISIPEFIAVFVATANQISVDQNYFLNTLVSLNNKAPPTLVRIA